MTESILWDIREAVKFCRFVEVTLKPLGWHCGLTGSTLYNGKSKKDVDVILYRHDDDCEDFKTVMSFLSKNCKIDKLAPIIDEDKQYPSYREIWQGWYDGKRVDIFKLD